MKVLGFLLSLSVGACFSCLGALLLALGWPTPDWFWIALLLGGGIYLLAAAAAEPWRGVTPSELLTAYFSGTPELRAKRASRFARFACILAGTNVVWALVMQRSLFGHGAASTNAMGFAIAAMIFVTLILTSYIAYAILKLRLWVDARDAKNVT